MLARLTDGSKDRIDEVVAKIFGSAVVPVTRGSNVANGASGEVVIKRHSRFFNISTA
jgi:hypothetical protein